MDEYEKIINLQIAWCKEQVKELRPFIRENPHICIYCGNWSSCRDHLLPRPWTGPDYRKQVPTVPSCQECNLILADRVIPTITERAEYIAAKLRIRYKKLLEMPAWSDKSLLELGPNLQASVRYAEHKRRYVINRIMTLEFGGAALYPGVPWIKST